MRGFTKKSFLIFFIIALYFVSAHIIHAYADSVIVHDNGQVDLVIGDVLSSATSKNQIDPKQNDPPKPSQPAPAAPAHTTVVVSPNKPSTVTVVPSKSENKVSVTVTQKPSPSNPTVLPVLKNESVDRVVLQGANNTTVVSIGPQPRPAVQTAPTSQPSGQLQPSGLPRGGATPTPVPVGSAPTGAAGLIIQQESVSATTELPIRIDTDTHVLSAPTSRGPVKLILPNVAVQNIENAGLLNASVMKAQAKQPQLTLTQDETGDAVYSLQESGKLFNILPISETISVSNATGRLSAPFFAPFIAPFLR